jgi:signal transduction histidine kinase/ActR/RegA family two-component response regulator
MSFGVRRLRAALIGAVVAVLATQAVVTWIAIERARADAVAMAVERVERRARGAEAAFNRVLVQIDSLLVGLPALVGPFATGGGMDDPAVQRILRAIADQNFLIRDVLLLDFEGRAVATALAQTRRRPPVLMPEYLRALTEVAGAGLQVSPPFRNPATGEWSLLIGRAVDLPSHGRVLALAEAIGPGLLDLLATDASAIVGAGRVRVSLERRDGQVLAVLPHDESAIGRIDAPPQAALEAGGNAVFGALDGAPDEHVQAARPLLYRGLLIRATLPMHEALTPWRRQVATILAVSLGFALLQLACAGLGLAFARARLKGQAETQIWRDTLQRALDTMSEGFMLHGPDDRIVAVNRAYTRMFPHLAGFAIPGRPIADLIDIGARAILPDGEPEEIERWKAWRLEAYRTNGSSIEMTGTNGRTVHTLGMRARDGLTVTVYRDVTEERRAAAELARAKTQAEAANISKSRFLATMSHEIRTPINGIMGMAGLLQDVALDDRARRYVDAIRDASENLLQIVNDVLDLSRLEAGRLDIERIPFEPRRAIESTVEVMSARAAAKGLTLAARVDFNLPATVLGDPGRVRQILFNLIGNAVKFTHAGRIDVMAEWAGDTGPQGELRFFVADTGVGIAEKDLPRLFEEFEQLDSSVARKFGGSGLGLSICRRLVRLMGGRIEARSVLGQGSVFCFALPVERSGPMRAAGGGDSAAALRAALDARGDRPRILIAEDNETNRLVVTTMLADFGIDVETVENGVGAVARARLGGLDAILMDVQMPEMDGLTATRAIRALDGAAGRVPIVALTANAFAEDREAALAAGMDEFVAKPFRKAALFDALRRALSRDTAAAAQ